MSQLEESGIRIEDLQVAINYLLMKPVFILVPFSSIQKQATKKQSDVRLS